MSLHLEPLNPAQRTAATTPAPLLMLAGAGSGKTETLIRRVADLILGGEAPERLLCITFTAKAAGEMRGRLMALLGPERTPRWVGTFHAVMARLLIEDGAGVPDLPRGFAILGHQALGPFQWSSGPRRWRQQRLQGRPFGAGQVGRIAAGTGFTHGCLGLER